MIIGKGANEGYLEKIQDEDIINGVVTIPEGVKTIGNRALTFNDDVIEINMPHSLKTIQDRAFIGCKNLKKVNIPEELEKVSGTAFIGCKSLDTKIEKKKSEVKKVNIPKGESIKLYRYMSIVEFMKMSVGMDIQALKEDFANAYTNSKGLCFLGEKTEFTSFNDFLEMYETYSYPPEECISFLGGIVNNDVLVEFITTDNIDLNERRGNIC